MGSLKAAVGRTSYPGRCVVIGMSPDGQYAVCAYSIMGRGVNSRNRVFVIDGQGLRTRAYDESKLSDPSLVIYAPLRVLGKHTIVTNGDQTDTIYDAMAAGGTFEDALRTRVYEPDAPHWTPRVSGLITLSDAGFSYKMSVLKRMRGEKDACLRSFYEVETPIAGMGHFLHTYAGDGEPLPPFEGEPEAVTLAGGAEDVAREMWEGLNEENKVSLFVRFIRLADGETETRVVNKLG
ncbi:MAG: IMP cyclohydrolase [Firmicutes bacterium]|nr:IMP cyclohydrolase [Bacillota bacterium]